MPELKTPTGLTLSEALKLQNANFSPELQSSLPPEGQIFTTKGGFGQSGSLYKRVGNQIMQVTPSDILLNQQEKIAAGNFGGQIGVVTPRLKAQGLDVNSLPQYTFPHEALARFTNQPMDKVYAAGTLDQFLPNLTLERQQAGQAGQIVAHQGPMPPTLSAGGQPQPPNASQANQANQARANITDVSSLLNNEAINRLETKLENQLTNLNAGVGSTSTQILEDMFKKFGVEEKQNAVNQYSQIILEKSNLLKKLPDDLKKTLENVGVSESQLNRLILKDSQKPLEALNEAMQLQGAAQERVNQSLQFVGMFTNVAMADQAAKLEMAKFQYEQNFNLYKDLKSEQRFMFEKLLDDKKQKLQLSQDLLSKGADKNVLNWVNDSSDYEEALSNVAPFYQQHIEEKRLEGIGLALLNKLTLKPENAAIEFDILKDIEKLTGVKINPLVNTLEELANNPPTKKDIELKDVNGILYAVDKNTGGATAIAGISAPGSTNTLNKYDQDLLADFNKDEKIQDIGVRADAYNQIRAAFNGKDFKDITSSDITGANASILKNQLARFSNPKAARVGAVDPFEFQTASGLLGKSINFIFGGANISTGDVQDALSKLETAFAQTKAEADATAKEYASRAKDKSSIINAYDNIIGGAVNFTPAPVVNQSQLGGGQLYSKSLLFSDKYNY